MSQLQAIKVIKICTWILMGFFVVIQFLLIVGVLFNKFQKETFEIEISAVSGVIMLLLNIVMFVIYCKYAGMPFKSEQHAQNLKHCGYVSAYWNMAFILKYITAFIKPISPDNMGRVTDEDDSESKRLFYVIIYFALSIICDIVPFLIVIDSQFIKICTFDLIRRFHQE